MYPSGTYRFVFKGLRGQRSKEWVLEPEKGRGRIFGGGSGGGFGVSGKPVRHCFPEGEAPIYHHFIDVGETLLCDPSCNTDQGV